MAGTRPDITMDRQWFASLAKLDGAETRRVAQAVDQFLNDSNHPGLNFHPVHADRSGRLHTFRASQELRVLVAKEGNLYLLLEAGHHDAIYERASRTRLMVNHRYKSIKMVEARPANGDADVNQLENRDGTATASGRAPDNDRAGLLDHWNDNELQEAGLSATAIAQLRSWRDEEQIWGFDLTEQAFDLAVDLLETTPEQWRNQQLVISDDETGPLRRAITEFGVLAGLSPVLTAEEASKLAAAPVEEWMVFLHPDQRDAVLRRFDGPARVRGSAGTGKTVVALHRAAALADRHRDAWRQDGRPILFTTYIKSLPPVFEALYQRMPGTVSGEVEFVNIDSLAFTICKDADDRPELNPKAVDAAFAKACRAVLTDDSPLVTARLGETYLREEITSVIKGRGLVSIDDYLAIERTGRKTPMPAPLREQVWQLHEAWDREMARRDTTDFPDVIRRARDHAQQALHPRYRAAIIDEAQDLTLVGLELIRSLVNGQSDADVPDGLFICGDGSQRIYPGGFTLRQAGVEVRGRTTVLRHNYRNTNEIIGAAMAVAGVADVDDLGDQLQRGDAAAEAARGGPTPTLVVARSFEDELKYVADTIAELADTEAVGFGDMAVTVTTNHQAKEATEALKSRGVPTLDLTKYKGTPSGEVKVGTHFRSKGLEFKVVFLPGLGVDRFPRGGPGGDPDAPETDELRLRSLSQLYVAMTRARDALFVLCSKQPADELADALESFELIEL